MSSSRPLSVVPATSRKGLVNASARSAWAPGESLTDAYVALLDKGDGLLQGLTELHANENDRQTAATEGGHRQRLALQQTLLGRNEAHLEALVDELVGSLGAHRVVLLEQLELCGQLGDGAGDLAVLDIVVAVLHVVAAQDLDLAHVLVALPLQEVDLLQQLLLKTVLPS